METVLAVLPIIPRTMVYPGGWPEPDYHPGKRPTPKQPVRCDDEEASDNAWYHAKAMEPLPWQAGHAR
jgi:hypothetical protein